MIRAASRHAEGRKGLLTLTLQLERDRLGQRYDLDVAGGGGI
jgi:hypothetical protein